MKHSSQSPSTNPSAVANLFPPLLKDVAGTPPQIVNADRSFAIMHQYSSTDDVLQADQRGNPSRLLTMPGPSFALGNSFDTPSRIDTQLLPERVVPIPGALQLTTSDGTALESFPTVQSGLSLSEGSIYHGRRDFTPPAPHFPTPHATGSVIPPPFGALRPLSPVTFEGGQAQPTLRSPPHGQGLQPSANDHSYDHTPATSARGPSRLLYAVPGEFFVVHLDDVAPSHLSIRGAPGRGFFVPDGNSVGWPEQQALAVSQPAMAPPPYRVVGRTPPASGSSNTFAATEGEPGASTAARRKRRRSILSDDGGFVQSSQSQLPFQSLSPSGSRHRQKGKGVAESRRRPPR